MSVGDHVEQRTTMTFRSYRMICSRSRTSRERCGGSRDSADILLVGRRGLSSRNTKVRCSRKPPSAQIWVQK